MAEEIGYADKRKEIRIITDNKTPKEPAHCHFLFRGETVGCILREDEAKGKMIDSKFREKKLLRSVPMAKFDFIPEIDLGKVSALSSLFYKEWGNNSAMGADVAKADRDMIFVARKFAVKHWGTDQEFAKFVKSTLGSKEYDYNKEQMIEFIAKELRISDIEAEMLLKKVH